ncbi:cytochrome-c peroxidase [Teredinibacter turnerae]|uniref:cytochrome-c peroxidase n=1 Tax=Teredinibacter turnerae TaxID=2426 RepID=UPI00040F67B7|nr:cytochrome c peroxidase [Teredinibacter turnerae]
MKKTLSVLAVVAALQACGGSSGSTSTPSAPGSSSTSSSSSSGVMLTLNTREKLGEALFHDVNLSANRSQACATCHVPEHAFVDNRTGPDSQVRATSLGDDGVSLGDRNTPTAAYAAFAPEFTAQGNRARLNSEQSDYEGPLGGQFLDGRAAGLADQAKGPPVNPVEMGMEDEASVVERLKENDEYLAAFNFLFGDTVFDDPAATYQAMVDAIEAFERTDAFASFDSKYDKSLRGEYTYSPISKAAAGKALFFSQQFTNCATCHQLRPTGQAGETFTGYEYHNIGVPANTASRETSGQDLTFVDHGLLDHPDITASSEEGKFKVPTLRNVAITAPYMHNGVFRELTTVLEFYDHFQPESEHTLNPETGLAWENPEVDANIAEAELLDGRKLSDTDIENLECFLRTLTDERFEHLLPDDGKCDL